MTRHRVPVLALLLLIAVGGCAPGTPSGQPPAPDPPAGTAPPSGPSRGPRPAASTGAPRPAPPQRPGPDRDVTSFRTAYGWGVPAEPALIRHRVRPPVAPPPAPPLPYLAEIRSADHPEGRPGYSRISFSFRGGFPSYELAYVAHLRAEGTGERIPLPGNAFLRIRFVQAQAHDERGRWSITASPAPELGFRTLRGYGFGGDYEGYLSYGLGIQVAAGSDQAVPVRALELTRAGGRYVVAVDVRHG